MKFISSFPCTSFACFFLPLHEMLSALLAVVIRDVLILLGSEVAVLCITKSGEVFNYQAFTDSKGVYKVAETMPQSDRWMSCLARPINSYHEHCTRRGDAHSGIKFNYTLPSGYSHTVKPFLYKPASSPLYCN